MKIKFACMTAFAAAFLPGMMHASLITNSSVALTATFLSTDIGAANAFITGAGAPTPNAGTCTIFDTSGCGVGGSGGGGCTNSPENPTVLLGVLGIAGLLVGSQTRAALQRRRVVHAAA